MQKSLGKNGIIQNSMLHKQLGIQIKQGWQFLYYCQNTIEKIFFSCPCHLFSTCFCLYTHIVKSFPRNFCLSLLKSYLVIFMILRNMNWEAVCCLKLSSTEGASMLVFHVGFYMVFNVLSCFGNLSTLQALKLVVNFLKKIFQLIFQNR